MIYDNISELPRGIGKQLEKPLAVIKKSPYVREVRLFGSLAQSDYWRTSDVDIAVFLSYPFSYYEHWRSADRKFKTYMNLFKKVYAQWEGTRDLDLAFIASNGTVFTCALKENGTPKHHANQRKFVRNAKKGKLIYKSGKI